MIIEDRVYGSFEIDNPVLVRLIESNELQRLKGINQQCIPKEWNPQPCFSRFDHSVGVMELTRRLGASLEEQVAALLHDVNHTAFSHMIDYVIGDPERENHQDDTHEEFVRGSELPKILEEFAIPLDGVVNFKEYKILESEAPELCADRIDYSLRELSYDAEWTAKVLADQLVMHRERMVFTSEHAACLFGWAYAKLSEVHWASLEDSVRGYYFGEALKAGLRKGLITKDDFYKEDAFVMGKLREPNDEEVERYFQKMKDPKFEVIKEGGVLLKNKFRWVDPPYLNGERVWRLTETNAEYRGAVESQREKISRGFRVNVE